MAYSTRSNLEIVFGKTNITKWADANNNNNKDDIAARIAWAIESADSSIDDRLRRLGFTLPFDPVPITIREISCRLAGICLYEFPRGVADDEEATDFSPIKEWAENQLVNISSGFLKLNVPMNAKSIPFVVKACE